MATNKITKAEIQGQVQKLSTDINLIQADPTLSYLFDNFLGYASHLIMDQAIPQFYDGFLPSQRGHILSMQDLGMASNKKHQKSTRVVAHQTGTYRPVGNTYSVLVNMSQSWNTQILLTDPEGGWGPQESGKAAAERYTETRLSKFSEAVVLVDTPQRYSADKTPHNIVPTKLTEFKAHWEEIYLPVRLPMLLINGGNGIAVGLAQTWQQWSYKSVLTVLLNYLKTDEVDYSLMELGYPTNCGIANTREELTQTLKTGKGSIHTVGQYTTESKGLATTAVIFHSVPPDVLLNSIGDSFNEQKQIDPDFPFSTYRNETSRDGGVKLVFLFKKPVIGKEVVDAAVRVLYRKCGLMNYMKVNMVALNGAFPVEFNLTSFLSAWVDEREQILIRISIAESQQLVKDMRRMTVLQFAKKHEPQVLSILHSKGTEEDVHLSLEALAKDSDFSTKVEVFSSEVHTEADYSAWGIDDTKILLQINLRQLSKLDEEDQTKRINKLMTELSRLRELITVHAVRRAYLIEEIQVFLDNRHKLGVIDYECKPAPEIRALLDVKSKAPVFPTTVSKPVFGAKPGTTASQVKAPPTYFFEELGQGSAADVIIYTESGLTYLVKNMSLRYNSPFLPKLLSTDKIRQAFFVTHENVAFMTGEGRIVHVDRSTLPVDTPITANKIMSLQKSKASAEDLKYCLPIQIQGSQFLVMGNGGTIKKVDVSDVVSIRQKIAQPWRPEWVTVSDSEVVAEDGNIALAPVRTVSYKTVGRLPGAYIMSRIPKLKSVANGNRLLISEDRLSIEKVKA